MSVDQADRSAKQFEQSTPKASTSDRIRDTRLHEQYKPVGIPAVSAAAQFASKAKKKTQQMS
jgi:hypothetical protein